MGSFLGIKMDQYWMDLFLWETFFNDHPIKLLIEFGTGYGGMSTYLALQCRQRGVHFLTFDNINSLPHGGITEQMGVIASYQCRDIFTDETLNIVKNALVAHPHPACLFFDDGDKPREWRTFAPHVSIGDFLVVHDWETEFKTEHATGAVTKILESDPLRSAYKSAWFRKDG